MSLKCGHCQCNVKTCSLRVKKITALSEKSDTDVQILSRKSQFMSQRAHFYELYFPPTNTLA